MTKLVTYLNKLFTIEETQMTKNLMGNIYYPYTLLKCKSKFF